MSLYNVQTHHCESAPVCLFTSTGIRRWNYFAAEHLLVYDIAKYRWCENVERFHKSNNIMYVCFLFC